MSVFIDANVLIAAANPRDRLHSRAAELLSGIRGPWTTDHVLVETWAVLASRTSHAAAMRFWFALPATPLATECVGAADLERARGIAETWADQEFDIVDCTSFAVMERLGCARAATFDRDFAIYRFGPNRARAFEVLR